jgi:nucleoid-associated protein YgaU
MVWRAVLLIAVSAAISLADPRGTARGLSTGDPQLAVTMLTELLSAATAVLLGWMVLVLLAAVTRRVPGAAGRLAERTLRVLVPATVRLALAAAIGVQAAALPAVAHPPATSSAAVEYPHVGLPVLGNARTSARPVATTVRVRPGDSLWRIAQRHLDPAATADEIAAAWPRWYERNRTVIGPDPDLLAVGLRLAHPDWEGGQT